MQNLRKLGGIYAMLAHATPTMPKLDFTEAVDVIIARDPRYDREAYCFLRDALDYTVKLRKKSRDAAGAGHVSGQQLLEGIRQYALKQFGPMVVTVLGYWGIRRCEDFGEMVFNLIRTEVFGKTDSDSIDDFKGGYSFQEAFVQPYVPAKAPLVHRRTIPVADAAAEQLN